jgi:hypothetical protein
MSKKSKIGEKDIESIIDGLNTSIEDMRNKKIEVKKDELPSNLNLMLSGISDSSAINFLFSHNIDKIIEKLFNLVSSGNLTQIVNSEDKIKDLMKELGFGEGSFEGPVSKTILGSVKASIESTNYSKIKDNVKRAFYIYNNLKREKDKIKDKETRAKYEEAIYAIKKVMHFAYIVYKNRKIVNNRVINGLKNIVNESVSEEEFLEELWQE